jgi:trans-aconitate 2-methyltransferase
MLAQARQRLPQLRFAPADAARWVPEGDIDLVFANAIYQWVPHHLEQLPRVLAALRPGGVLAVQMPDNLGEPSHLMMEETAHAGPWKAAFEAKSVRRKPLPPPSTYYSRLIAKAARIDIWHTVYNHPMANGAAIVEWVKGTGLMPYLANAGEEHREAFIADYLARIEKAYPAMADGRVLLRFPRLFMVAVKG